MGLIFLSQINYFAVAAAAAVYFLLGSLWFSTLFGSIWAQELKEHKVIIQEPTPSDLLSKMIQSLLANILTAFAMACLVILTGSTTLISGLFLGIIAAIGFAATTLASVFTWENRSVKLFLLDIGYPVLGIVATAIILSLWH